MAYMGFSTRARGFGHMRERADGLRTQLRRGVRRGGALGFSAILATSLAACGAGDRLTGETFQVVSMYLEPNSPDELPASAAGAARLVVGESTMTGSTGCAPLQAAVEFSQAESGRPAPRAEADTMRITNVEFHNPGDCDGGSRFVHDSLAQIFTADTDFRVDRFGETELVLTKQTGQINQPAIRLMSQ